MEKIYKLGAATPYAGDITMSVLKKQLLRIIGENAGTRAAKLSKEYIKADSGEKEAIQAGIEFEKWMYEIAQLCLNRSKAS